MSVRRAHGQVAIPVRNRDGRCVHRFFLSDIQELFVAMYVITSGSGPQSHGVIRSHSKHARLRDDLGVWRKVFDHIFQRQQTHNRFTCYCIIRILGSVVFTQPFGDVVPYSVRPGFAGCAVVKLQMHRSLSHMPQDRTYRPHQ